MPERQSAHPDNDLIDQAEDIAGGGTGSTSGGTLQKEIGSRAELDRATGDGAKVERVHKQDEAPQPPQSKTNRQ